MSHPDELQATLGNLYNEGFKAGWEAGMREAARIANEGEVEGWVIEQSIRAAFSNAILSAIEEKK